MNAIKLCLFLKYSVSNIFLIMKEKKKHPEIHYKLFYVKMKSILKRCDKVGLYKVFIIIFFLLW